MPDWRPAIRERLARVDLAPARAAEIEDELAQHLDDRWRDLVSAGEDPVRAEQLTVAELRDADGLARRLTRLRQAHWTDPAPAAYPRGPWLAGLWSDVRLAVRSLRASLAFTGAALLVLALGIGATTAIFSVVDAVVLRALPFDRADRLVAVGERRTGGGKGPGLGPAAGPGGPSPFGGVDPQALLPVQPQNYLDVVAQQQSFEAVAAIASGDSTLIARGRDPEAVSSVRVSPSFFDVLRVAPAIGHTFTGEADRAIVLGDAFWRRAFGGDATILGQIVTLDGEACEVVGVMPARFTWPVGAISPADVLVPYAVPATERERGRGHGFYLQAIARLKDNVTIEHAAAELSAVAARLEQAYPEWNGGTSIGVRPLLDHLVGGSVRSWMLMLLAGVGLVMLIACANVANLLLARATARQREVAVRTALGASRWRLVRQFVVESCTLSMAGAAVGVLLAAGGVALLRSAMPASIPRAAAIGIDLRVLAASSALAMVAGLLCGVVPAWQSSRADLALAMNQVSRGGGTGRHRHRLNHVLVAAELGLAVVLVVGSALFIASFLRVIQLEPGFNPGHLLTAQVYQRLAPGQPPTDLARPLQDIAASLETTRGITSAAAASPGIPLRVNQRTDGLDRAGHPPDRSGVSIKFVTEHYHRTLGIALRAGRLFEPADFSGTTHVALLNEAAARHYFPSENAIGQTASVAGNDRLIVGIVANARLGSLEANVVPEIYLPMNSGVASGYLVIRSDDDPYTAMPAVRSAIRDVLPATPPRLVASMDELIAAQTAQRRLTMLMLGLFGVLGLVIAAVGVYGVIAYVVAQRTREIGVRIALGASRARVVGLVMMRGLALLGLGMVAGELAAWWLAGSLKSFLFRADEAGLAPFVSAAAVLSITAAAACFVPALRAASVDPTETLRSE
jgi:predicted permease